MTLMLNINDLLIWQCRDVVGCTAVCRTMSFCCCQQQQAYIFSELLNRG